jgi:hypothetical protein
VIDPGEEILANILIDFLKHILGSLYFEGAFDSQTKNPRKSLEINNEQQRKGLF